ncbi:hypothetical protein [Streptomyces chryseus]
MGDHEIPDEDDVGARCDEHGVTLLWRGPPITPEDFAPYAPRPATPADPVRPSLGTHPR